MLGSTVVKNTTFVMVFSSKSVSGGFPLVDCSPFILMCRCPIVVFLDFSMCFLMSFYVRTGHVFREHFLISLSRLDVVGLNNYACKYWYISGLDVCARILFTTVSDCWVTRGTSHISVLFF